MSNIFKKSSVRGFTLIELLVVIAIIGLLSTIIAAPIQSARKKARDAKKIAEVKSTQLALEQYAESNSAQYPLVLNKLSPQFMPLLSSFAASTTSNRRDAFAYVTYEALATGGASTTFSYHLGSKLEVYGPALETDRDCIWATLSSSLSAPYCAVYNGNGMIAKMLQNGSQLYNGSTTPTQFVAVTSPDYVVGEDFDQVVNPYFSGSGSDYTGLYAEVSTSTCVAMKDCIFDVTSQQ